MSAKIIAFSGKGGSGKTTITSMVLRQLVRTGRKPVLAVDADANATLSLTLGVAEGGTIADLRDSMGQAAQKVTEIPKDRLMDQYLAELLNEQDGFDLLTMGRPEGPKCYCYVNAMLRRYLSLLRKNYAYVLIDCEAGMEYLSRLTVDNVEALVLVAEGTAVGLTTAKRIAELADSLSLSVGRRILAVNKVRPGRPVTLPEGFPPIGPAVQVPLDEDLQRRCEQGRPVDETAGAAARGAIVELTDRCLGFTPAEESTTSTEESLS